MFILRRISSDGIEMNQSLGDSYTLITKEANERDFKEALDIVFGGSHDDDIYAFVGNDSGGLYPLYDNQENYIMTPRGNTFSNITRN